MTDKKEKSVHLEAIGHDIYQAGRDLYITTGKLSSLLEKIIPAIQSQIDEMEPSNSTIGRPYKIDEKIEYNCLNGYRYLIDEYAEYGAIVDQMYETFDEHDPGIRNKIFRFIKAKYIRKKSEIASKRSDLDIIGLIRTHSDAIIGETIKEIKEELEKTNLPIEQAEFGAQIVVSHAFINCKILERPNAD